MSASHPNDRNDDNRGDADDALSPSDGYFHASDAVSQGSSSDATRRQSSNVPSIPNVLVEDPTLQQGPGVDKAREAEEERILNTAARHTSPPSTSPPPQPSSSQLRFPLAGPSESANSRQQDQLTSSSSNPSHSPYPVLPNQSNAAQHYQDSDAPPAYTPTSPITTSGYQTFPSSNSSSTQEPNIASLATGSPHNMGNPEEQPFLPYHQQGPGHPDNTKPPAWQQGQRSSRLRRILKTILGILVVVSIFLAIFGVDFENVERRIRPPKFGHQPVKNPVMDNPSFDWRPDSGCFSDLRTQQKFEFDVDFALEKSFYVLQKVEKQGRRWGSHPHIKGDASILPAKKGSAGRAIVELLSNEDESTTDISYSTSRYSSELKIVTPESLEWSEKSGGPCIQIRVTLYVPIEALAHRLSIETVQLDIGTQDGIVLGVGESVSFQTVSGDIWTSGKDGGNDPYELATAKQHVGTVSGNIDGWFSLYDKLEIVSVSGDIGISISPRERKADHVADLKVESISGTVEVQEVGFGEKVDDIPKRDYRVNVQTTSGDVRAGLLVGKHAAFESLSGNLEVDVWPVLDKSWTSEGSKQKLTTQTTSGDVNLRIREPIIFSPKQDTEEDTEDGDEDMVIVQDDTLRGLTNLEASHGSISGNQKLVYPAVWQGKAHASTMSGNVKIHGKGVTVSKKGGWVEKQYDAAKGEGDSRSKIETISGDVNLQVGSD